jgi:hypothetical protein
MKRVITALVPALLLFTGCLAQGSDPAADDDVETLAAPIAGQPAVQLAHAFYKSRQLASDPGGYTRFAGWVEGYVEVENLAYVKQIVVHSTDYSSPTWVTANAQYVASIGGNREIWTFKTAESVYLPYFGGGQAAFAIEYKVNGQTNWDNNGSANYVVSNGGISTSGAPEVLAKSNVARNTASLLASPTDPTKRVFSGDVVLKNLAYAKVVKVRYTTDNWVTYQDVGASYGSTVTTWNGGSTGLELWNFSAQVPASVAGVKFAITYAVNGQTYSDNNFLQNYTVSF